MKGHASYIGGCSAIVADGSVSVEFVCGSFPWANESIGCCSRIVRKSEDKEYHEHIAATINAISYRACSPC